MSVIPGMDVYEDEDVMSGGLAALSLSPSKGASPSKQTTVTIIAKKKTTPRKEKAVRFQSGGKENESLAANRQPECHPHPQPQQPQQQKTSPTKTATANLKSCLSTSNSNINNNNNNNNSSSSNNNNSSSSSSSSNYNNNTNTSSSRGNTRGFDSGINMSASGFSSGINMAGSNSFNSGINMSSSNNNNNNIINNNNINNNNNNNNKTNHSSPGSSGSKPSNIASHSKYPSDASHNRSERRVSSNSSNSSSSSSSRSGSSSSSRSGSSSSSSSSSSSRSGSSSSSSSSSSRNGSSSSSKQGHSWSSRDSSLFGSGVLAPMADNDFLDDNRSAFARHLDNINKMAEKARISELRTQLSSLQADLGLESDMLAMEGKFRDLALKAKTTAHGKAPKYVVCDTNCYIHLLQYLKDLKGCPVTLLIPSTVLQELNYLKKSRADVRANAAEAIRYINESLQGRDSQQVHFQVDGETTPLKTRVRRPSNDQRILECCLYFKPLSYGQLLLLTEDVEFSIVAKVHGIACCSLTEFHRGILSDPIAFIRNKFIKQCMPVVITDRSECPNSPSKGVVYKH